MVELPCNDTSQLLSPLDIRRPSHGFTGLSCSEVIFESYLIHCYQISSLNPAFYTKAKDTL